MEADGDDGDDDGYYYPIFKHPFTLIISGATGSGKTEWLMRLLRSTHTMIEPAPAHVIYCYGELNENILRIERGEFDTPHVSVEAHHGAMEESAIKKAAASAGEGPLLLVLDDLLANMSEQQLNTLFTRGSHNWGVSVILVTQHLFARETRVARNNSHYLVLMRNPAGETQVANLASQLFARRRDLLLQAYRDATAGHFSYLLVDMHPSTESREMLKTHIYPEEWPIIVYAT